MRMADLNPSFTREARGRRFSGLSGRLNAAAIAVAIGALLAACAPAASPSIAPSLSPVGSASTLQASPTAASPFPLTLVDDEGTSVTIPAEPRRIVSLTPGTTEILFALGVGDRVVATDSASDYPAAADELPDVAAFGTVDAEKIVGLEADLVIAGGNGYTPPDGVTKLRSLGIPVLVVYAATVAGVSGDVELVGKAVGRAAEGTELAAAMRADLAALAAAAGSLPKPRTFYEVDATNEIYGPADHSFLAEMVELAGGSPVTSGSADNVGGQLRDPPRTAHRRGSGSDHPRGCRVRDDGRRCGEASGLGRHDRRARGRGSGRRRQAHHPAGPAARAGPSVAHPRDPPGGGAPMIGLGG